MARSPGADAVYELADSFRDRCLIQSKSLLWPDDPIWTIENIAAIERIAFEREDPSVPQELVYWDDVSRTLTPPLRKLGADVALMYQLFPSKSAQTKFGDVKYMFQGKDAFLEPDIEVWELFEQAADHGLGDAGRWYLSGGQQWSALFYLRFANEVKTSSSDVYDRSTMQEVADRAERSIRYNTVTARNMILHLLFPDYFEPISNQSHKEDIRAAFCHQLGIPTTDDIDHDLKIIRDRMVADGRTNHFSFYDGDLRAVWNNWRKTFTGGELASDLRTTHRGTEIIAPENDLTTLVGSTHLNEPFLDEINDLLLTKRQLIFEGPPGSGKTFVAEKFARWFTGQPLDGAALNEQVQIVQFHQSYGYEDFVQGIRPETNEQDQLVYRVRDGIFLQMCELATANPKKNFVLIIDEINRGNLSRIFGELLLLLEYRNQSVRLPYGTGDSAYLRIPENLYIIGTMNTADRSLAQIDYALRRRFYFVRFMPVENGRAEVFENWLDANGFAVADKTRLRGIFVNLNRGIREHLNTDDLQVGHSYFMQEDISTEAGFNRVWKRAVRPLLEEYLHHHRNRADILAALTPANLMEVRVEESLDEEATVADVADESGVER